VNVIDVENSTVDKVFALVYGASGTGKTHLMGTLGELGKVLIIDIDQGVKTIQFAQDLKKYHPNITAVSFDRFKDLDAAAKLVEKNDPALWSKEFGVSITEPFDWVCWDTWSEIQWSMMQELRSKDSEMKGVGLNFRKGIQIQHWGMMTDLNKLAVEELRKCKVNQVFTMQEKLEKDELTGQIYGGPAIHGKLVQEMPAYFDIVVHTMTDLSGKFCATTKSKGKWPGKTRIGSGQDFVNPTAKDIFTV
jgi:hypothetical protein